MQQRIGDARRSRLSVLVRPNRLGPTLQQQNLLRVAVNGPLDVLGPPVVPLNLSADGAQRLHFRAGKAGPPAPSPPHRKLPDTADRPLPIANCLSPTLPHTTFPSNFQHSPRCP